ncbi:hypothetical protein LTS18_006688 [Coniosporium uncinatum]|uniref:Uncharacterized protein n=1 Tax=Coniosporium uncinatum TaxID=93489 RepID=A0ACC3DAR3_9PEZI|nr:hypothetical protein LTS18_006688 [Coniosporium uncinatum]
MTSVDFPWLAQDEWARDELKRRQNLDNDGAEIELANNTLNALYDALVKEAIISDNEVTALEDDNANNDLDAEVLDGENSALIQRCVREPRGISALAVFTQSTSVGPIIANSTHVPLANGVVSKKVNLKKLIVSDKTSRVFHSTQNGHALIANMILYWMRAHNAQSQVTNVVFQATGIR